MDWKGIIARASSMFHAPKDAGAPADQPPPFSAMRVVFVVCSVLLVLDFCTLVTVCTIRNGWHMADIGSATGATFGTLLASLLTAKCYQSRVE